MLRLVRLVLIASVVAVLAPSTALAGQRMFVGFQDDPAFRWTDHRFTAYDTAHDANATVLRTTVYWDKIAPTRPARGANPFDAAYEFDDLDEFVRGAQQHGAEVLLTIWGTPGWANGGKGRNRMPTNLADLRAFTTALASRYSGRYAGYPYVRFYSVWNEPNLEQFLAPQYNARGRSVSPALYARLYRAAYTGLKIGNRNAVVGIGETSARGRDKPTKNPRQQDTHSPGKFAELLAKADRRLPFDAWSHHPYPTSPTMRPEQKVRWPNVSLASLPQFDDALERWFKRSDVRIWVSEYGHETSGAGHRGVSYKTQAAYVGRVFALVRNNPDVDMFIWFILRDHANTPWQSGLLEEGGTRKPAFARFARLARTVDARNAILPIKMRRGATIRVSALSIAYYSKAGAAVGVTYRVFERGRLVEVGQPQVALGADGWFTFRTRFTPARGRSYVVRVEAGDANGNGVLRSITLVTPKPKPVKRRQPRDPFRR